MKFVLKSRTFILQLFDYRLNQCLSHRLILTPRNFTSKQFGEINLAQAGQIPVYA